MSKPRRVVLLLIYAAFVSMGLPDGILGAAWPQMRAELRLDLNENWPMLALGSCGSALSSFLSGAALRRLGVGRVLLITTFLTASVVLSYSLGATFGVIVGLAFFLGLGNGAIDAGLNNFVATNLSSRHMSWLHACWGVGVSLGTLLVSGVLTAGGTWRGAYQAVGLLQLMLALAFLWKRRSLPGTPGSSQEPSSSERSVQSSEHPSYAATFRLPAAWASMLAFVVYCGLECGAGLWVASVLHDGRGWTTQAAGLMATLYWVSLTVGRFLVGTISARTTPLRIVRAAVLGAIVGTALIALSSLPGLRGSAGGVVMAAGLMLTGLSLAPVFPMLMHDTPRCVGPGHAVNLIGFQGAMGQLGFTLLPIGIGTLLRFYSTEWLGAVLATLAVALLLALVMRERYALRPS